MFVVNALTSEKLLILLNRRHVIMNLEDNAVVTLSKLDLSALEAKVYLTLSKYEELTAAEISKLTQTARPDVYRVVRNLQEKGLVEKILKSPVQMKAVPINVGLQLLLRNKKDEYDEIKRETNQLFDSLRQIKLKDENNLKEEKFVLVPKKEAIIAKIRQAIDEAQESVDLILSFKRFFYGTTHFMENLSKAWDREVKFRVILEKPKKEHHIEEALQICRKSNMCQIRFFNDHPAAGVGLYDKKSVFIVLNPREDVPSSPALWSNSRSLLAIVQDYFNVLWICLDNKKINNFLHPT